MRTDAGAFQSTNMLLFTNLTGVSPPYNDTSACLCAQKEGRLQYAPIFALRSVCWLSRRGPAGSVCLGSCSALRCLLVFLAFSSHHGYRSLQQNSLSESTEKGRERGERGRGQGRGWRGRGGDFNTIWPYHLGNKAGEFCQGDLFVLLPLLCRDRGTCLK